MTRVVVGLGYTIPTGHFSSIQPRVSIEAELEAGDDYAQVHAVLVRQAEARLKEQIHLLASGIGLMAQGADADTNCFDVEAYLRE